MDVSNLPGRNGRTRSARYIREPEAIKVIDIEATNSGWKCTCADSNGEKCFLNIPEFAQEADYWDDLLAHIEDDEKFVAGWPNGKFKYLGEPEE